MQFKAGEGLDYLAKLYGQPIEKVEQTIRDAMQELEVQAMTEREKVQA